MGNRLLIPLCQLRWVHTPRNAHPRPLQDFFTLYVLENTSLSAEATRTMQKPQTTDLPSQLERILLAGYRTVQTSPPLVKGGIGIFVLAAFTI